jgi:hypothetical protein
VYTEKKARQLGRGPRFVRWAVMLGIVILLNIVFVVARGVIFPAPVYDNSCVASTPVTYNQTSCTTAGGNWVPSATVAPVTSKPTAANPGGYCDYTQKCEKPFEAAQQDYATKSFIFLIALGVVALIVGILPLGSSIVSTGLSYGGVLAFIVASVGYWNDAPQLTQLGISLVALGALIYIGFKRFRD